MNEMKLYNNRTFHLYSTDLKDTFQRTDVHSKKKQKKTTTHTHTTNKKGKTVTQKEIITNKRQRKYNINTNYVSEKIADQLKHPGKSNGQNSSQCSGREGQKIYKR